MRPGRRRRHRRRHRADSNERRPGVDPETGTDGAEWVADVQDAGNWFVAGAWIMGLAGLVGIVALVGFYDVLKHAGPVSA
jgi:hypothetical protein